MKKKLKAKSILACGVLASVLGAGLWLPRGAEATNHYWNGSSWTEDSAQSKQSNINSTLSNPTFTDGDTYYFGYLHFVNESYFEEHGTLPSPDDTGSSENIITLDGVSAGTVKNVNVYASYSEGIEREESPKTYPTISYRNEFTWDLSGNFENVKLYAGAAGAGGGVSGNRLTIKKGNFTGATFYGGYIEGGASIDGSVCIQGGTFSGTTTIYGSYTGEKGDEYDSHDGTVKIFGGDFSQSTTKIYASKFCGENDTSKILYLGVALTADTVENFDRFKFIVPSDFIVPSEIPTDKKMLTVTGNAVSINGVAVNVYLNGYNGPDTITLIDKVGEGVLGNTSVWTGDGENYDGNRSSDYEIALISDEEKRKLVLKSLEAWYVVVTGENRVETKLKDDAEAQFVSNVTGDVTIFRGAKNDDYSNLYVSIDIVPNNLTIDLTTETKEMIVMGNIGAGTVEIKADNTLIAAGGLATASLKDGVTNNGTLTIEADYLSSEVNNGTTGTVNLGAGTLAPISTITGGTLNITGDVTAGVNNILADTINVAEKKTLTLNSGGEAFFMNITNNGTVNMNTSFATIFKGDGNIIGKISGGVVNLSSDVNFTKHNLSGVATLNANGAVYNFSANVGETPSVDQISVTAKATGTITLGTVDVTGKDNNWKIGDTKQVQYLTGGSGNDITVSNTTVSTSDGYKYTFSQGYNTAGDNTSGVKYGYMDIFKDNGNTLKETVEGAKADTYALLSDYTQTEDIDTLGGDAETSLTIEGNAHKFMSDGFKGITVPEGKSLTLDGIAEISGWTPYVADNDGTLSIKGQTGEDKTVLDSAVTSTKGKGAVDINGNVEIGANGSITQKGLSIAEGSFLTAEVDALAVTDGITNNGTLTLKSDNTEPNTLQEALSGDTGKGTLVIDGGITVTNSVTQNALTINEGKSLTMTGEGKNLTIATAVDNKGILTVGAGELKSDVTNGSDSAKVVLNEGILAEGNTVSGGLITIDGNVTAQVTDLLSTKGITANAGGILTLEGEGALNDNISGEGTTVINGTLTSDKDIANEVTINTGKQLTNTGTISGGVNNKGTFITTANGITGGVKNSAALELTGGDLGCNITDETTPTGTVTVSGTVSNTNKKSITQNSLVITGSLTTEVDALHIGTGEAGPVTNNGILILQSDNIAPNTLEEALSGDTGKGNLVIDGGITVTNSVTQNALTINVGKSLTMTGEGKNLTIATAVDNKGTLTVGAGELKSNVTNGGTVDLGAGTLGNYVITGGTVGIKDEVLAAAGSFAGTMNLNIDEGKQLTLTGGTAGSYDTLAAGVTLGVKGTLANTGYLEVLTNLNCVTDNDGTLKVGADKVLAAVDNAGGTVNLGAGTLGQKITGGSIVTFGNVTADAANLAGTVSNGVNTTPEPDEPYVLTLTGSGDAGILGGDITGAGRTVVSGTISNTNNKGIIQADLIIAEGGSLTTEVDALHIGTGEAGPVTNNGTLSLTADGSGADTLQEAVNGDSNKGTLNFSGDRKITAGGAISQKAVNVNADLDMNNTLTAGTVTVAADKTLTMGSGKALTVANAVANSGILIIRASDLLGNVTNGGTVDLGAGTLGNYIITGGTVGIKDEVSAAAGSFAGTMNLNIDEGKKLTLTGGTAGSYDTLAAGVILGVKGTLANTGYLEVLTDLNCVADNDGTLKVGADKVLAAVDNAGGTVNLAAGTLAEGSTVTGGILNIIEDVTAVNAADIAGVTNNIAAGKNLTLKGGILAGDLSGEGAVIADGEVSATGSITVNALTVNAGKSLTLTGEGKNLTIGTAVDNKGTLTVGAGELKSDVANGANGTVVLNEGILANGYTVNGGKISVNGNVTAQVTDLLSTQGITANAGGILTLEGEGALNDNISGEGTTVINGSISNAKNIAVDVTVNEGKSLTSTGNISGAVTNNGTFDVTGGEVSGAVTNNGTLAINGGNVSGAVANNGEVNLSSSTLNGVITGTNGSSLNVTGDVTAQANKIAGITALTISEGKTLILDGGTDADNYDTLVSTVTLGTSGTLKNTGFLDAQTALNCDVVNDGTLKVGADKVVATINNREKNGTVNLGAGTLGDSAVIKGGHVNLTGAVAAKGDNFGTGGDMVNVLNFDTGSRLDLANYNGGGYDSINIGVLTGSGSLDFDIDLSKLASGNTSLTTGDKFSVGNVTVGTTLVLKNISVTGALERESADNDAWEVGTVKTYTLFSGDTKNLIITVDGSESSTLTNRGYRYSFVQNDTNKGDLDVTRYHSHANLYGVVQGETDIDGYVLANVSTYSLITDYEETDNLGTLGNITSRADKPLTIDGNGYVFAGNSHTGIILETSGDTLNLQEIKEISGWKDYVVDNGGGTVNIKAIADDITTADVIESTVLNSKLTGEGTYNLLSGILTVADAGNLAMSSLNNDAVLNLGSGISSALGADITGDGIVNINGIVISAKNIANKVIINAHRELTNTGNISGVVENNGTLINVDTGVISGAVTNNAIFITTANGITGGVKNIAALELTGGDLGCNITDETTPTGTVTISGEVTNTHKNSITQKSLVITGSLTTDADGLTIIDGITNNSTLTLTGDGSGSDTLQETVNGNGILNFTGDKKITASGAISQKAVNVGADLNMNNNLTAETVTIAEGKTLTMGSGRDLTVSKATDGIANSGTLVVDAGNLKGDVTGADGSNVTLNAGVLGNGYTITGGSITVNGNVTAQVTDLLSTQGINNESSNLTVEGTGALHDNISGDGTTVINGIIINAKTVGNAVTVNSGKQLTNTGSISGAVLNNGTLINTDSGVMSGLVTNDAIFVTTADGITGGVKNTAALELTDGDLGCNITDKTITAGTTTISGEVTNTKKKSITQKNLIVTGSLTTEVDALHISTSDAGPIVNDGTLTLQSDGSNSDVLEEAVNASETGKGNLVIDGAVTVTNTVSQNALTINEGKTLTVSGGGKYLTIATAVDNKGTLTVGAGELKSDVTNGEGATVVLNAGTLANGYTINGGKITIASLVSANVDDLLSTEGISNATGRLTVTGEGALHDNISGNGTTVINGNITNAKTVGNAVEINSGKQLTNTGTISRSVTNYGRFEVSNGIVNGIVLNNSVVNFSSGMLSGGVYNNAAGTVNVSGGEVKTGAVTNAGIFNVTGGEVSSAVVNGTTGVYTITSGTQSGSVENNKDFNVTGGEVSGVITNNATGVLNISGSGKVHDVTNAGTVEVNCVEGLLGDVTNSSVVNLNTEGTLATGSTVRGGTLNVKADITADAGDIAGTTNVVDSGKTLNLTGGTLGGTVSGAGNFTVAADKTVTADADKIQTVGANTVDGTLNLVGAAGTGRILTQDLTGTGKLTVTGGSKGETFTVNTGKFISMGGAVGVIDVQAYNALVIENTGLAANNLQGGGWIYVDPSYVQLNGVNNAATTVVGGKIDVLTDGSVVNIGNTAGNVSTAYTVEELKNIVLYEDLNMGITAADLSVAEDRLTMTNSEKQLGLLALKGHVDLGGTGVLAITEDRITDASSQINLQGDNALLVVDSSVAFNDADCVDDVELFKARNASYVPNVAVLGVTGAVSVDSAKAKLFLTGIERDADGDGESDAGVGIYAIMQGKGIDGTQYFDINKDMVLQDGGDTYRIVELDEQEQASLNAYLKGTAAAGQKIYAVRVDWNKVEKIFTGGPVNGQEAWNNMLQNDDKHTPGKEWLLKVIKGTKPEREVGRSALNQVASLAQDLGVERGAYDVTNMVGGAVDNHWKKGEKQVWASYIRNKDRIDRLNTNGMDAEYTAQYNGAVVGVDLTKGFGLALAYADGSTNNIFGGRNSADYYGGSMYFHRQVGNFAVGFDATYLYGNNELSQNVFGTEMTGKAKTDTFSSGLTARYLAKAGKSGDMGLFTGARYMQINSKKFSDNLGISHEAEKINSVVVPAGLEYNGKFKMQGSDWTWKPKLAAGYLFNLGNRDNRMVMNYRGTADRFLYDFADKGAFFAKAGMAFEKKNLSMTLGYDFMKSKNSHNSRWNVGVNLAF